MKRVLVITVLLLFAECDNSAERAPINMKKGDAYFASKEYEIAEYYYDKIPEDSPLYKEAQLKVQQIDEIETNTVPKAPGAEESRKVTIFDQSITSNADGMTPVHSVCLNNESTHRLASVVLEFTYYDASGNVIAVKQCKVSSPMSAKTQETFTEISPGRLEEACAASRVKVISAEFH